MQKIPDFFSDLKADLSDFENGETYTDIRGHSVTFSLKEKGDALDPVTFVVQTKVPVSETNQNIVIKQEFDFSDSDGKPFSDPDEFALQIIDLNTSYQINVNPHVPELIEAPSYFSDSFKNEKDKSPKRLINAALSVAKEVRTLPVSTTAAGKLAKKETKKPDINVMQRLVPSFEPPTPVDEIIAETKVEDLKIRHHIRNTLIAVGAASVLSSLAGLPAFISRTSNSNDVPDPTERLGTPEKTVLQRKAKEQIQANAAVVRAELETLPPVIHAETLEPLGHAKTLRMKSVSTWNDGALRNYEDHVPTAPVIASDTLSFLQHTPTAHFEEFCPQLQDWQDRINKTHGASALPEKMQDQIVPLQCDL